MNTWLDEFKYSPLSPLLDCHDEAISLFAWRDLLDQTVSVEALWHLLEPQRLLRRQRPNGSWIYPGGKEYIRTQENYDQLETYRNVGILVEEFGFHRKHPAIQNAAEYLFSFQSQAGDFRGIYGNQYSPNYSAGITELLIKAGYQDDPVSKKSLNGCFVSVKTTVVGLSHLEPEIIPSKLCLPTRKRLSRMCRSHFRIWLPV